MRVALCPPKFPPEFIGGTEKVVLALARELRSRGDEVVILTGTDRPWDGSEALRDDFDGFEVLRLPRRPEEGYGLDLRRPRLREVAVGLLREAGIDVLHVHHWALLTSGLLRAARDVGIGGIATLHDMWVACPRFFRRPPPGIDCPSGAGREACVRCVILGLPQLDAPGAREGIALRDDDLRSELSAARRVTAPSRACANRVREHLPWAGEVEVVPHGLLEPVDEAERRSHVERRAGDPIRVGSFGNLVEEKGVMLLVYACRGIPNLELHLAGPFLGEDFAALVRSKAREFGLRLIEHGAWQAGDPHPALQLDLAVFPSLCEETYGLVVEEALARGVPVVVSNRGALGERIGAGGLVVDVGELGPLECTLRELCADPARIDALRAGVPARFSTIAEASARYRALYEQVLAEVRR